MRQGITRLTALAAMVLAVSAMGEPAQASSAPGWRVIYQSRAIRGNYLDGIVAVSRSDAWAIGRYGQESPQIVLHWNGRRWRAVRLPAAARRVLPDHVYATSPANVWITGSVGSDGEARALVWNGASWHMIDEPEGVSQDVAVLGPANAWASVEGGCTGKCSLIYHWNGSSWAESKTHFTVYELIAVGGHVLALADGLGSTSGSRLTPALYELSGSRWIRRAMPAPTFTSAEIAASSLRDIWVLGTTPRRGAWEVLYHWNGRKWSRLRVPQRVHGAYLYSNIGLTPDGHGGTWLGPYAHWTGRKWVNYGSEVMKFSGDAYALAVIPGTRSTWLAAWTYRHNRTESAVAINGKGPA